ncbi:hypothetical protein RvY_06258 [Ramazzottius varieornatus]|uniref:Uncharacterized protein n=1 Tax=Ramazzottius varieornatus TaxID=947166 RepID=A0A1D1UXY1_RAMVA|nr:hypothetical protein RvY_06258 [Ramazzottius varieornatus]
MVIIATVGLLGLAALTVAVLPDGYELLTAKKKQDILWTKMTTNPHDPNNLPTGNATTRTIEETLLNVTFLTLSFDQAGDEMAPGRPKVVSPRGLVGKAEVIMDQTAANPYTGVYKTGGLAVIRLGGNPGPILQNFFALKILIDGKHSQNFHAEHDVIGRMDPVVDYFEDDVLAQYAAVDPPPFSVGFAVVSAFNATINSLPGGPLDRPPNAFGLGGVEQARVRKDGRLEYQVYAPHNLLFRPAPYLHAPVNLARGEDYRKVLLATVKDNMLLYTIEAKRTPCDPFVKIGEVWTRSKLVSSPFGDQGIRFGQPYRQWDYSFASPGPSCTLDPNIPPASTPRPGQIDDFANPAG